MENKQEPEVTTDAVQESKQAAQCVPEKGLDALLVDPLSNTSAPVAAASEVPVEVAHSVEALSIWKAESGIIKNTIVKWFKEYNVKNNFRIEPMQMEKLSEALKEKTVLHISVKKDRELWVSE